MRFISQRATTSYMNSGKRRVIRRITSCARRNGTIRAITAALVCSWGQRKRRAGGERCLQVPRSDRTEFCSVVLFSYSVPPLLGSSTYFFPFFPPLSPVVRALNLNFLFADMLPPPPLLTAGHQPPDRDTRRGVVHHVHCAESSISLAPAPCQSTPNTLSFIRYLA